MMFVIKEKLTESETTTGLIMAVTARTNKTLKTLDHMIFHNHISHLLFNTATTLVTNSGKDVHTARILIQINLSLIPKLVDIDIALSTTIFHHIASHTIHHKNNKIGLLRFSLFDIVSISSSILREYAKNIKNPNINSRINPSHLDKMKTSVHHHIFIIMPARTIDPIKAKLSFQERS